MSKERTGELYIFGSTIIWSFFPIITVLSYKNVPSIISLSISTFIATIFFFILVIYKRKLYELRNRLLWKYIFYIVFFIGILFYLLYFLGLTKTTAGNASIIGLFEIFTSYLFFNIIKKEPFSLQSKIGAFLMIIGVLIILAPNFSSLNFGDLFIFIAMFFAPIGNFFQQKAKLISSTETILFLRSLIATPCLFLIAYFFGQYFNISDAKESFLFLIINGFIMFGLSKIFWLEAISRISVTKANALHSLTPLLTLLLAWFILHQTPTYFQIASLIPLILGVLLLTDNIKLKFNYAN
jgi:drug/metabolite transporter (DMT)-like permease